MSQTQRTMGRTGTLETHIAGPEPVCNPLGASSSLRAGRGLTVCFHFSDSCEAFGRCRYTPEGPGPNTLALEAIGVGVRWGRGEVVHHCSVSTLCTPGKHRPMLPTERFDRTAEGCRPHVTPLCCCTPQRAVQSLSCEIGPQSSGRGQEVVVVLTRGLNCSMMAATVALSSRGRPPAAQQRGLADAQRQFQHAWYHQWQANC